MRFTRQKEMRDAYHQKREVIKTGFLWFPLTLNLETRWLEKAEVVYKVAWGLNYKGDEVFYWEPVKFNNK